MADNTAVQSMPTTDNDENHIIAERRQKLNQLRAEGPAFPNDFKRTDLFGDIQTQWGSLSAEELEAKPIEVAVSFRVRCCSENYCLPCRRNGVSHS